MCVIMVAEKKRLGPEMIRQANTRNPDGLGMAWLEDGVAQYRKSISIAEALTLRASLPLPYVLHARFATEGGVEPSLCHPFPITTRKAERLEGRAPRLLFHNGTWSDWQATLHRIERRFAASCPKMAMSDSRAMAWIVATAGEGVLDMPHGQRFALIDASGVHRYGAGWKQWRGFWCSNLRWLPSKGKSKGGSTLFTGHKTKAPQAPPAGVVKGFYTVPTENGSTMLVKASSVDEAFKVAEGRKPGWRRQMATSEEEQSVQSLEEWMGESRNAKAWQQPLINIDNE